MPIHRNDPSWLNRDPHRRTGHPALLLLLILQSLAGCQHATYKAASLPAELLAPPVVSARQINLAKLNRSEVSHQAILPGDLLNVTIVTGLETTRDQTEWVLQVAEDGTVEVPLVGSVQVRNMEPEQARTVIYQASVNRGIYRNPNVSVEIRDRHKITVTVMGAVEKPGPVELPPADSHLLSALMAAGGLADDAKPQVEIRHPLRFPSKPTPIAGLPGENPNQLLSYESSTPQPRVIPVNLQEASETGVGDFHLEDGSVVMVHSREKEWIYVVGLVNKPNAFELPLDRETRLLDAMAMAGGRRWEVADKVTVVRQHPKGEGQVSIACSIAKAKEDPAANLLLAPGDVVSIDETPLTATLDTLKNFMRFSLPLSPFLL